MKFTIDTTDGPIRAIPTINHTWLMLMDDEIFDEYFFEDVVDLINQEVAPID